MTTAFAGAVLDADGRPFDRIRLTGLSATGHHGVFEHEKADGQLFRADVVLHLDTRAAAQGDDLARTVSYAGVAEDVVAVLAGSPADLVETVAERIAATILTHQDVVAVDVAVHKPQAPITVPFEDVEVVIRRDRVVVPVVAPLRRHDARPDTTEAREAPPAAPIPVGSVAPALIHGVENVGTAEDHLHLAPAPDVMPPSISPVTGAVVEAAAAPVDPAPEDPFASYTEDEPALGDEPAVPHDLRAQDLDATREAPVVVEHEPVAEGLPEQHPGPFVPEPAAADAVVLEAGAPHDPVTAPAPDAGTAPAVDPGPAAPAASAPVPVDPAAEAVAFVDAPPEATSAASSPVEEVVAAPVEAVIDHEHDRMDDVPAGFVDVVLALGANLGDAQQTLRDAITDLDRISGLEITEVSPLARTAAVGGPEQPDFLNTVLLARTRLSARDLLFACQAVEQSHGRVRDEHWGPRTLDVDLIVYGTLTAVADDLELPHPRAHERAFVLEPWSQIDPDAVLPGLGGGPVAVLAATAPDRAGIRWLALDWLTEPAPEPTGAAPAATGSTDVAPQPATVRQQAPAAPPAQQPAPQPPASRPAPEQSTVAPGQLAPASAPVAPAAPVPEAAGDPAGAPHVVAPAPQQLPPQQLAPQQLPPQSSVQNLPQLSPQQHPAQQQPSGAALPVAPPQTLVPEVRPVFAPVSEGVAPAPQPDVAPPSGLPQRQSVQHPAPVAPVRPAAEPPAYGTSTGAPAAPVFGPVHPVTPDAHVVPAVGEGRPHDDGIIRSVPFAPVSEGVAAASAPGPLADTALHTAGEPWPPFPPVSGSSSDDQR